MFHVKPGKPTPCQTDTANGTTGAAGYMPHLRARFWVVRVGVWGLVAGLVVSSPVYAQADSARRVCDGDVFCALVADPRVAGSFVSVFREQSGTSAGTVALVGIGERVVLGDWVCGRSHNGGPHNGVRLSVEAGVLARFGLGVVSYGLLNADYMVGVPLAIRSGRFSTRFRVYHQSSHAGDGYPAQVAAESFESIEALGSIEAGGLRVYGGGEVVLNRGLRDSDWVVAHVGAEWRPARRVVVALDVQSSQEYRWRPGHSVRAGFEPGIWLGGRRGGFFAEYRTGQSPYRQHLQNIRYMGAGLHIS